MKHAIKPISVIVTALVGAVALVVMSVTTGGVALAASTLLVLGGNSNPNGVRMEDELNGLISTRPGTPYAGYTFTVVPWPAQFPFTTGSDGTTAEASQQQGVANLDAAIRKTAAQLGPGEKIVVVGYSTSADVVIRELRTVVADPGGVASPDQLSFIVFGNPDRPNGGIFARFPGFSIPAPVGVVFDGANPSDTKGYQLLDISWEYDGFSDFPTYPTHVLSVVNAVMGMFLLHSSYFDADLSNAIPDRTYTSDGVTYVTLHSRLPLLIPFAGIVPSQVLDAIEPALRVLVDLGYDRTTPSGVATPAGTGSLDPFTVAAKFSSALLAGLGGLVGITSPTTSSTPLTTATLAASATAVDTESTPTESTPSPAPEATDPAPSTTGSVATATPATTTSAAAADTSTSTPTPSGETDAPADSAPVGDAASTAVQSTPPVVSAPSTATPAGGGPTTDSATAPSTDMSTATETGDTATVAASADDETTGGKHAAADGGSGTVGVASTSIPKHAADPSQTAA
ncbi:PE-PPE domain-containing protein [Williamsia sterculiae]|uniref:PE-PPE domain-containing protein n=1 Tax=Williamsia sterculiae TaxID=1344003 RepID=A0A1N7CV17_9NOCA|nr:PE-PPE domain-containing protein [Williamsia sterculiae]SIR67452.1 PE-PPE domain-containing protein [Williamsia sterculiae]